MIIPKKSLGQHFLHDENIARKIVEHARIAAEDVVLEIGPGKGALTRLVRERTEHLIGIELDARAIRLLEDLYGSSLRILHQDIRSVDARALSHEYRRRIRVIGNIPYNITSEILFWVFDAGEWIDDAILMMQLEVARRLVAGPGTKAYGILSIMAQWYSEPAVLFRVSPNSFHPRPNVSSAVVQLRMVRNRPEIDEQLFRNVIRSTFGKRRKTLQNSLKYLGLTDDHAKTIAFDLSVRPEQLSVDDFRELTEKLLPMKEELDLPFS